MDGASLQPLAWCAAFWVAFSGFAAREGEPRLRARCALGLALGAALGHLGWAALHAPLLRAHPAALLDPTAGSTVLLLPLGPLACAPWRAREQTREAYLAAAFAALPLALAVARAGCLAAGCCFGPPSAAPWALAAVRGGPRLHPTPAYEMLAWVALAAGIRRLRAPNVVPAVLAGFALVRLAMLPLRTAPSWGEGLVAPALLCMAWLGVAALFARAPRGGYPAARPPLPRAAGTGDLLLTAIRAHVRHHGRFYASATVGIVGWVAMHAFQPATRLVVAGDAFFACYLVSTALLTLRATPAQMREHSRYDDEGVFLIFVLTGAAVTISLVSIFVLVNRAQRMDHSLLALTALSVPLGWLMLHTVAAFHYAHLYYAREESAGNAKDAGGLAFPSTDEPEVWDFLYYSFVVGMTAQVSDVQVLTMPMRRLTLLHGIGSFFFNTVLLALAVNVAAGAAL